MLKGKVKRKYIITSERKEYKMVIKSWFRKAEACVVLKDKFVK